MAQYISPVGPAPDYVDQVPDSTSLKPGHYGKPLLLDRIFVLLTMMVETLQKTAQVQAQRLNFLSQWQTAQTDELNQIHAFVADNGDAIGDSDPNSDAAHTRQDLNTVNTTYTQQIQAQTQLISSDAKALQTNLNATNDQTNNTSDQATAILQTLQTILTSIKG